MYCRHCGKEIDDNAAFCPYCGKATNDGQTAQFAQSAQPQGGYAPVEHKSKIAAGLLGIFLGSLGVHNFYLGYTSRGVAQLLITLCTCGVGACVTGIWGLVEGIMILTGSIKTDAQGIPLGD
jgi:TM2 domain-containing membrane protein YozV